MGIIELLMIVAAVTASMRIADLDDRASPGLWGLIAVGLCVGAMFVLPMPGLRILGAFIVTVVAMTVSNALRGPAGT